MFEFMQIYHSIRKRRNAQVPQEDLSQTKKSKTDAGESRIGGFMKRIKVKQPARKISPEVQKNSNTSDQPYFLRRQSSFRSKLPKDITVIADPASPDDNADSMSVVIDRLVENFRGSFDSPNNTLNRPKRNINYVKNIVAAFEEKYGSPEKNQRPAIVRRVAKVVQPPRVETPAVKEQEAENLDDTLEIVSSDKLKPAVERFWSDQMYLETKLKNVDQKVTSFRSEPLIVGAFLKKPVQVGDKKIDYIPIENQKLPRKRSLKRVISEMAEKRLARSLDSSGSNRLNLSFGMNKSMKQDQSITEERIDFENVPVPTLKRKSWSKSLSQAPKKAREFCSFPKISANKPRAGTPLKEIFENNNNIINSMDMENKLNKEHCDCVTPSQPVKMKIRSVFSTQRPRSDALDEVKSFYRRYDCTDADLHNLVQKKPVDGNDMVLTLRNLKLHSTTDKGRPKSAVVDTRPIASVEEIESYAAKIRKQYLGNKLGALDVTPTTNRGSGKVQPEARYVSPSRSSAFFENRMKNANFDTFLKPETNQMTGWTQRSVLEVPRTCSPAFQNHYRTNNANISKRILTSPRRLSGIDHQLPLHTYQLHCNICPNQMCVLRS